MFFRTATPQDFPALIAIEADAGESFTALDPTFNMGDGGCTPEDFQRGLDEATLLVAEVDHGAPLGFLLLWRIDNTAHIRELDVLRAHQGQALGRQLIAQAEHWAADNGYTEITLTTFRDVPWNAPYYTSLGYTPYTPSPNHPTIAHMLDAETAHFPNHPRIAMRKPLA
jgi:GNAT superfamily N-acetyltransferase